MDYNELYDESPYSGSEAQWRGGKMSIVRSTFLICATVLASVFATLYYGYQQEQYVVTSNGVFVSIFDKKTKTINICDKITCSLINPKFELYQPVMPQAALPALPTSTASTGSGILNQIGQLLGSSSSKPTPAAGTTPQLTVGGIPQGTPSPMGTPAPQAVGQVPIAAVNPQLMAQRPPMQPFPPTMVPQQMMPPMINPQMMAPQMINAPQQMPQMAGMPAATQQGDEEETADEESGTAKSASAEDADAGETEGDEEAAPV
ncbi:MAG: hypothetical protein FJX71_00780 [Alphaproteobacteria bacterium]|nr:hypothetical protein [Alphaproteobacteria bacterium]